MDDNLKKIFYDPAIGLSSADKLFELVKKDTEYKYTRKYVKDWYDKQQVNQVTTTPKPNNIVYPQF